MWTCDDCNETHDDNFTACWNCGKSRSGYEEPFPPVDEADSANVKAQAQHVESHLLGAILVTVCCCLPFGIVAIVYAAQVSPKLAFGDYEGAVRSSKSADRWIWVGIIFGILGLIIPLAVNSWIFSLARG